MIDIIDGGQLRDMIRYGAAAIHAGKQSVNDLNVFPVPDGDTGTNMSLTIATAVSALAESDATTVGDVLSVNASALLRGARGNSGVILSLLFRGIARYMKGKATMDGADFAAALSEGVSAAYGAVMKPAEGTILTVSRLAAERAAEAAEENPSLQYVLQQIILRGEEALDDTVNQNPVLRKAGVIDAGGKGFLMILSGMSDFLSGVPMAEAELQPEPTRKKADFSGYDAEDTKFAFDTVIVVRKTDLAVDLSPLRDYLDSIGDSRVITGEEADEDTFKVHVHTNIPGEAVSECQKYGTLELAKIENMRSQTEALAAGREAPTTDDLYEIEKELLRASGPKREIAPVEKKYGFVAVCAGAGLETVFTDLGVDRMVSGGQTMNPSTEDLLRAIDSTPSEIVYVLPNNKNIILAAQQCVPLSREKKVVVVESHSVPEGISAMLAVDPEKEEPVLTASMSRAVLGVQTAQITYAARDSSFEGVEIKAGDYLALLNGELHGTSGALDELLCSLAEAARDSRAEFVTLLYGEDVSDEQAQRAGTWFERMCPEAEVSVISGGQPVYYYLISIE